MIPERPRWFVICHDSLCACWFGTHEEISLDGATPTCGHEYVRFRSKFCIEFDVHERIGLQYCSLHSMYMSKLGSKCINMRSVKSQCCLGGQTTMFHEEIYHLDMCWGLRFMKYHEHQDLVLLTFERATTAHRCVSLCSCMRYFLERLLITSFC